MSEGPASTTSRFGNYSEQSTESSSTPDVRPNRRRWVIVEEFDSDGFKYRVSRRPVDATVGPQLTRREKEVLEHASRGHNNKLIASALGVAPSTIGVLLFRAAAKVGAKSRRELLRAFARMERTS
jgi:DNA-binding CsgD family transcriptional regulator